MKIKLLMASAVYKLVHHGALLYITHHYSVTLFQFGSHVLDALPYCRRTSMVNQNVNLTVLCMNIYAPRSLFP